MVAVVGALFNIFSGHRPAQRDCARTGLRSHARCHPYPIPQPVKVGHATGVYNPYSFRIVMWVLLRPIQSLIQGKYSILFPTNAILKLDDRTEVVRFEITSMISDQNRHDTKFNYYYITAILASQNSVSANILLIGRRLVEVESETL